MLSWEYLEQQRKASSLAAHFTQDERERLVAMRAQGRTAHLCSEFGLDQRRLRFVRWLVDHGRIGEGVECEGGHAGRGAA